MTKTSQFTVRDRHLDDRSHIVPSWRRNQRIGQHLGQLNELGIVPQHGAKSRGGQQAISIHQWQNHRVSQDEDRFPVRPPCPLFESGYRTRIVAASFGKIGFGNPAFLTQLVE